MKRSQLLSIPGVNKETAAILAAMINGKVDPEDVSVECKKWVLSCYNEPPWHEKVMEAANELIGGHGVESLDNPESCIEPLASFVNLGDTYITTLLFDYDNETFVVSSWGDFFESTDQYQNQAASNSF